MPELKMSDGVFPTMEEFQRAKIKIWHTAVTEMFKKFNEASVRLVRMMHMHFIALSLSRCNDAYVLTPLSPARSISVGSSRAHCGFICKFIRNRFPE